jgi:uncharacterized protein (TIGR03435 family)
MLSPLISTWRQGLSFSTHSLRRLQFRKRSLIGGLVGLLISPVEDVLNFSRYKGKEFPSQVSDSSAFAEQLESSSLLRADRGVWHEESWCPLVDRMALWFRSLKKQTLRYLGVIAFVVAPSYVFLTAQTQYGAQPQPSVTPDFSVVSIKPAKDDGKVTIGFTANGFEARGIPLAQLVRLAFNLQDFQLEGVPRWTTSTLYDVTAKVDDEDLPLLGAKTIQERWQMLRPVLERRFNLKYHWSRKDETVYALVIAKGGIKLGENQPLDTPKTPDENKRPEMHKLEEGRLQGVSAPISMLVQALALQAELSGRLLLDQTGLTGKYSWDLRWTPIQNEPHPENGRPSEGDEGSSAQSNGMSLFTAITEQLGLRIASQKAPVPVLVVDEIAQPSAN